MKAINIKQFDNKGVFEKVNDYLRKEQKEFLFNKKSDQEEKEYFNFFKFLFNSPDSLRV
jgi:hypothetical protein